MPVLEHRLIAEPVRTVLPPRPPVTTSSLGISPWIIALTVMLATFMEVLDTSVANVSLLHIAGNLAASLDESTWVLTAYLVSNAIVLPLAGWFSTLFGRKRFYMFCAATFTVASCLCGFAPSLDALVVFRILQGLGGGALHPSRKPSLSRASQKETRHGNGDLWHGCRSRADHRPDPGRLDHRQL